MSDNAKFISDEKFRALEHPLQRRRFVLALIFAMVLFPLIALGLILGTAVLVVPLFGVVLWISGRMLFAFFLGNSILVSNLNYPRVYLIGEQLKSMIGYKKLVNIFVYEQGNFNAYLMKFMFYRKAVFLNSELLEKGVNDDEIRWLVGRFIGYLRARQQAGFWGWTIRAAQKLVIFNLFLLPYERAMVYTGDRLALEVIDGDISCAVSVMQKLFVGRQLGYSVNPGGIVDQQRLVKGSFFAFLARIATGFPHMTSRYVDLIVFARSYYPARYAKFEAENPGLPADLGSLGALSQGQRSLTPAPGAAIRVPAAQPLSRQAWFAIVAASVLAIAVAGGAVLYYRTEQADVSAAKAEADKARADAEAAKANAAEEAERARAAAAQADRDRIAAAEAERARVAAQAERDRAAAEAERARVAAQAERDRAATQAELARAAAAQAERDRIAAAQMERARAADEQAKRDRQVAALVTNRAATDQAAQQISLNGIWREDSNTGVTSVHLIEQRGNNFNVTMSTPGKGIVAKGQGVISGRNVAVRYYSAGNFAAECNLTLSANGSALDGYCHSSTGQSGRQYMHR